MPNYLYTFAIITIHTCCVLAGRVPEFLANDLSGWDGTEATPRLRQFRQALRGLAGRS